MFDSMNNKEKICYFGLRKIKGEDIEKTAFYLNYFSNSLKYKKDDNSFIFEDKNKIISDIQIIDYINQNYDNFNDIDEIKSLVDIIKKFNEI